MELSIDTSTGVSGVAVSKEGKVIVEHAWRAGLNHTKELYPIIDASMKKANVAMSGLTAVVVAVGPGRFSGLRVGVSAAKGIAATLNLPLVAINTMEVEAAPFVAEKLPICVLLDAGRGEIAYVVYDVKNGALHPRADFAIASPSDLCASIRERTLFCGEHLPAVREMILTLGSLAIFPSNAPLMRQPRYLAELGWRKLASGGASDTATLQPIYLRAPSISKPKPPSS